METPIIHLNGSSAETLIETIEQAHTTLRAAISSLAECAPHPRDFYVGKEGAYERARKEHWDRMTRLQSVQKELEIIVSKIDEQVRR